MVSALVFAPPPPLVGNKALFTYGGVEILLVNSCYRKRVQVTLKTDTLYLPGDAREKIVLVETNVLPTAERHVAVTSEQEIPRPLRTLVDYPASDFFNDEESHKAKSSKQCLNTKTIRSYTEPDFMAEMWKHSGKTKPLKGIFRKRKYSRFTNESDKEDSSGSEFPQVKSKLNLRTKILTRRSQRQRNELEVAETVTRSLSPSSMFHNYHGEIQASFSFAAHVRRQGPGFSASCTQTLRTSDFCSISDLFESEVHSNVTFNPLFEDDDGEDDDYVKRTRPRRYRLYTIDEESEHYDSGS